MYRISVRVHIATSNKREVWIDHNNSQHNGKTAAIILIITITIAIPTASHIYNFDRSLHQKSRAAIIFLLFIF